MGNNIPQEHRREDSSQERAELSGGGGPVVTAPHTGAAAGHALPCLFSGEVNMVALSQDASPQEPKPACAHWGSE